MQFITLKISMLDNFVKYIVFLQFLLFGLSSSERSTDYIEGSIRQRIGTCEIYHNSQWRHICGGENWTGENSKMLCRMLGYKTYSFHWKFVSAPTRTWMDNIRCSGNERNIDECEKESWSADRCDYVTAVSCEGEYEGMSCGGRVCDDSQTFCCSNIYSAYCCNDVFVTPLKPPSTKMTTATMLQSTTTTENDGDSQFFGYSFYWLAMIAVAAGIAICLFPTLCRSRARQQQSASRNQLNAQIAPTVNRTLVLPSDDPPTYSAIFEYHIGKDSVPNIPPNIYSETEPIPPPPPYSLSTIA